MATRHAAPELDLSRRCTFEFSLTASAATRTLVLDTPRPRVADIRGAAVPDSTRRRRTLAQCFEGIVAQRKLEFLSSANSSAQRQPDAMGGHPELVAAAAAFQALPPPPPGPPPTGLQPPPPPPSAGLPPPLPPTRWQYHPERLHGSPPPPAQIVAASDQRTAAMILRGPPPPPLPPGPPPPSVAPPPPLPPQQARGGGRLPEQSPRAGGDRAALIDAIREDGPGGRARSDADAPAPACDRQDPRAGGRRTMIENERQRLREATAIARGALPIDEGANLQTRYDGHGNVIPSSRSRRLRQMMEGGVGRGELSNSILHAISDHDGQRAACLSDGQSFLKIEVVPPVLAAGTGTDKASRFGSLVMTSGRGTDRRERLIVPNCVPLNQPASIRVEIAPASNAADELNEVVVTVAVPAKPLLTEALQGCQFALPTQFSLELRTPFQLGLPSNGELELGAGVALRIRSGHDDEVVADFVSTFSAVCSAEFRADKKDSDKDSLVRLEEEPTAAAQFLFGSSDSQRELALQHALGCSTAVHLQRSSPAMAVEAMLQPQPLALPPCVCTELAFRTLLSGTSELPYLCTRDVKLALVASNSPDPLAMWGRQGVLGRAVSGAPIYCDSTSERLERLPEALQGGVLIKLPKVDRWNTCSEYLRFTVGSSATCYLLSITPKTPSEYPKSGGSVGDGWRYEPELKVTASYRDGKLATANCVSKHFAAGATISISGNCGTTPPSIPQAHPQYFVVLIKDAASLTSTTGASLMGPCLKQMDAEHELTVARWQMILNTAAEHLDGKDTSPPTATEQAGWRPPTAAEQAEACSRHVTRQRTVERCLVMTATLLEQPSSHYAFEEAGGFTFLQSALRRKAPGTKKETELLQLMLRCVRSLVAEEPARVHLWLESIYAQATRKATKACAAETLLALAGSCAKEMSCSSDLLAAVKTMLADAVSFGYACSILDTLSKEQLERASVGAGDGLIAIVGLIIEGTVKALSQTRPRPPPVALVSKVTEMSTFREAFGAIARHHPAALRSASPVRFCKLSVEHHRLACLTTISSELAVASSAWRKAMVSELATQLSDHCEELFYGLALERTTMCGKAIKENSHEDVAARILAQILGLFPPAADDNGDAGAEDQRCWRELSDECYTAFQPAVNTIDRFLRSAQRRMVREGELDQPDKFEQVEAGRDTTGARHFEILNVENPRSMSSDVLLTPSVLLVIDAMRCFSCAADGNLADAISPAAAKSNEVLEDLILGSDGKVAELVHKYAPLFKHVFRTVPDKREQPDNLRLLWPAQLDCAEDPARTSADFRGHRARLRSTDTPDLSRRPIFLRCNCLLREILTLDSKVRFLALLDSAKDGSNQRGPVANLVIDRNESVFESAYNQLGTLPRSQAVATRKLRVQFAAQGAMEIGEDAGGLSREFFSVLSSELALSDLFVVSGVNLCAAPILGEPAFSPRVLPDIPELSLVLDEAPKEVVPDRMTGSAWALRAALTGAEVEALVSGSRSIKSRKLEFVGRLLGFALRAGIPMPLPLAPSCLAGLLGLDEELDAARLMSALKEQDPALFQGLKSILEADEPQELGLVFTASDEGGAEVELCADGADVEVTAANREAFVCAYVRERLRIGAPESLAMRAGFVTGTGGPVAAKALSIFSAQDLGHLLCGAEEISVEDWRTHTKFVAYDQSSEQVGWFWQSLAGFSQPERCQLLKFVTGSAVLPHGGWGGYKNQQGERLKCTISKDRGGAARLPSASTCFAQLNLPEYGSAEELDTKLRLAVELGQEGFGLV